MVWEKVQEKFISTVKLNNPILSHHALVSIGISKKEKVLKNGVAKNSES